jgi:hypothetical protein
VRWTDAHRGCRTLTSLLLGKARSRSSSDTNFKKSYGQSKFHDPTYSVNILQSVVEQEDARDCSRSKVLLTFRDANLGGTRGALRWSIPLRAQSEGSDA